MELSAGSGIYESGDVVQTQRVIFIVLIQCGNGNHSGKKASLSGAISQTVSGFGGAGTLPHIFINSESVGSQPLGQPQRTVQPWVLPALVKSESAGGSGCEPSHVTTCLLFLVLLKVCNSSISLFAHLLFAFPNVSFLRAAAYLCLKVDSPAHGQIPWFMVDTRKGPVSSDLENKLVVSSRERDRGRGRTEVGD